MLVSRSKSFKVTESNHFSSPTFKENNFSKQTKNIIQRKMASSSGKSVRILIAVLVLVCLGLFDEANGAKRFFRNRLSADINKPFVLLYEHESFRGKEFVQYISKECVNLPREYTDWASSVDTHRACASVCISRNCAGPCHNVYSNQGMSKLRVIDYNDKIKSVKSCF